MTTRAEEIAAEGPYRVEWSGDNRTARVVGPDFMGQWQKEPTAVHRCADMNAAYKQGQQDRWISVETRLPELPKNPGWSAYVLIATSAGEVYEGRLCYPVEEAIYWDSIPQLHGPVTHWCEYPSPPNPEQR